MKISRLFCGASAAARGLKQIVAIHVSVFDNNLIIYRASFHFSLSEGKVYIGI